MTTIACDQGSRAFNTPIGEPDSSAGEDANVAGEDARAASDARAPDPDSPATSAAIFGSAHDLAVAETANGTLLAVVTQDTPGSDADDAPGSKVIARRSEDGGDTWGSEIVIFEPARNQGADRPSILVDHETQRLIVLYTREYTNGASLWAQTSEDDGRAWSEPYHVAAPQVEGFRLFLSTRHGVQQQRGEHAGRLVVGAMEERVVGAASRRDVLVFSDDGGETFQRGTARDRAPGVDAAAAAALVETIEGRLLLYRESGEFTYSADGSLSEPFQSPVLELPLGRSPSLLRYLAHDRGDAEDRLLLAGGGEWIYLWSSSDEGATFREGTRLPGAESDWRSVDLVRTRGGRVGALHHGTDRHVYFTSFGIHWLDQQPPRPDECPSVGDYECKGDAVQTCEAGSRYPEWSSFAPMCEDVGAATCMLAPASIPLGDGSFAFDAHHGTARTCVVDEAGCRTWAVSICGDRCFDFERCAVADEIDLRDDKVRGSALALDQEGSIYVAGTLGQGGVLVKLDQSWAVQWRAEWEPVAEGEMTTFAVTLDAQGSAYILGSTTGHLPGQTALGGSDLVVVKVDPAGSIVWSRQFGTEADDAVPGFTLWPETTGPHTIGVDADGNAYALGESSGPDGVFFAKLDADGTVLWQKQGVRPAGREKHFIMVEDSGHSYIATARWVLRKQDPDGETVWTEELSGNVLGVGTPTKGAFGAFFDRSGAIHLVGETTIGDGSDCQLEHVVVSPDAISQSADPIPVCGAVLGWAAHTEGVELLTEEGRRFRLDPNGTAEEHGFWKVGGARDALLLPDGTGVVVGSKMLHVRPAAL